MNIIDTCKENRIVRTSVKMYIELFGGGLVDRRKQIAASDSDICPEFVYDYANSMWCCAKFFFLTLLQRIKKR